MKKNVASKVLAGALASAMVLSMAACGDDPGSSSSPSGSSSSPSSTTPSTTPSSGSADNSSSSTPEPSGPVDYTKMEPMKLVVSVPGDTDHYAEQNDQFDRLRKELNERLNVDITWQFDSIATYYDRLGLKYAANDVADILVVGTNAAFYSAALGGTYQTPKLDADGNQVMQDKLDANGQPEKDSEGNVVQEPVMETYTLADPMFWDLTDYLQDYDNLATIPEGALAEIALNGRNYSLPRSRPSGRNGWGFRQDWLNKLGLPEPETWEQFKEMLKQFTYNDPDGNGQNDTVGLMLDNWGGVFDIMQAWFGVPNKWGLDKDGQLVYYAMTDEYKVFLKEMRELYDLGYINNGANGIPDFEEVDAGKATTHVRNGIGGVGIQVLDDLRKVETRICSDGTFGSVPDTENEDELIFTLRGWILTDAGNNEPHVAQFGAASNAIAISKTGNIKTEEDLKRALWVLNEFCDGDVMNLVEFGWQDVTYEIDEEGYVYLWMATKEEDKPKLEAAGVKSAKWNDGFNQVITYYTAEANARPVDKTPATAAIMLMEERQKLENQNYLVVNQGAGYTSDYYTTNGEALDKIISDARLAYIKGKIDDSGLEQALNQWWTAGGETVTKEMNAQRNAAMKK